MKNQLLLLALTLLVTGCTGSNSQIANPASTNCVNKGYTLELRDNTGYCVFPDGSECEEWSFYREECAYSREHSCGYYNGTWISGTNECEGVSQELCARMGGMFNECASACRNDPGAEFCTLQCVIVCEFVN